MNAPNYFQYDPNGSQYLVKWTQQDNFLDKIFKSEKGIRITLPNDNFNFSSTISIDYVSRNIFQKMIHFLYRKIISKNQISSKYFFKHIKTTEKDSLDSLNIEVAKGNWKNNCTFINNIVEEVSKFITKNKHIFGQGNLPILKKIDEQIKQISIPILEKAQMGQEEVLVVQKQAIPEKNSNKEPSQGVFVSEPCVTPIPKITSSKLDLIKEKQEEQLHAFEAWKAQHQWEAIKNAHYDWWMFPVDQDSSRYQATYKVDHREVEALKSDANFMNNYRRGMRLVVEAWGWDLEKSRPIANLEKGQGWDGYGVRLAKMSDSSKLFDQKELHSMLKTFFEEFCLRSKTYISDRNWLLKTFELNELAYPEVTAKNTSQGQTPISPSMEEPTSTNTLPIPKEIAQHTPSVQSTTKQIAVTKRKKFTVSAPPLLSLKNISLVVAGLFAVFVLRGTVNAFSSALSDKLHIPPRANWTGLDPNGISSFDRNTSDVDPSLISPSEKFASQAKPFKDLPEREHFKKKSEPLNEVQTLFPDEESLPPDDQIPEQEPDPAASDQIKTWRTTARSFTVHPFDDLGSVFALNELLDVNDPVGLYISGSERKDSSELVKEWQKANLQDVARNRLEDAATQEYTPAWVAIGEAYEKGTLFKKDLDQAFKYYSMAADKGNRRGKYHLGRAYFEGIGVPKDIQKGLNLIKEASKIGLTEALFYVGSHLTDGEHSDRALKYFQAAALRGNVKASVGALTLTKTLKEATPFLTQLCTRAGRAYDACNSRGIWNRRKKIWEKFKENENVAWEMLRVIIINPEFNSWDLFEDIRG